MTTTSRRSGDRYAVADLMAVTAAVSDGELAAIIGVSRSVVNRRKLRRGLDAYEADRWSVAAGFLPWEVWPDWLQEVMGDASSR